MSSTNKTTYYELSQYVGTDIINPLTDFNGDNEKIDTALHQIAEAAGSNAADITALAGRVTTEEGKVTALETQNGSDVLVTSAQTLSGAVNELKNVNDTQSSTLSAHTSSIDNLSSRMTTAEADIDTLETNVNTLETNVTTLNAHKSVVLNTVASDGVKTWGTLFSELLTGVTIDKEKISNYFIKRVAPNGNIGIFRCTGTFNSDTEITFESVGVVGSAATIATINSAGKFNSALITASAVTFTDDSNNVCAVDNTFTIELEV